MNKAVIGLGYGDEGKGQVTDYLSSSFRDEKTVVARYCGGHQAGHTVVSGGVRHVFSNFGSGTVQGLPTYWMRHCTVSPVGVFNEFQVLRDKGLTPTLLVDRDCPVVTPYDKIVNRSSDRMIANGTCGVGFGSTIQREESFHHLQYLDLFNPFVLKNKLDAIRTYYGEFSPPIDLSEFLGCCEFMVANFPCVDERAMCGANVIFEGAQGLMLDQDIGFFPHVTRSRTGSERVRQFDPEYYLVTRAYQTRHGNGPMSNEDVRHNIKRNPLETNVTNEWQGEFRVAVLDVDILEYALRKDGLDRAGAVLCVTCLDHVRGDYRFTRNGELVYCDDEEDFVIRIAFTLGIGRVMGFEIVDGKSVKIKHFAIE